MINNKSIEYIFINDLIVREICEKFQITLICLFKVKKIKNYDN